MLVLVLLVLTAFLSAMLVGAAIFFVAEYRNEVPPVFTPYQTLGEVIGALNLPKRGRLVDLGCGDGRILAAAVKRQPDLTAVGVENNPVVIAIARIRLRKRAEIRYGEILGYDLSGADRVFAYLGPNLMAALEPKLERELAPGTRLVSQQFPLPHRKPDKMIEISGGRPYAKKYYVYDY